jgi:hypothetical protein
MWIPESTEEIEAAVRAGDLEETSTFDAKRELPTTRKKNQDLAIDVAAMSTDGGVLLYGVGEDDDRRPTVLAPLELAGAADRVSQIVSTSISEVPYIEPREYRCPEDPPRGYLLVVVPMSARAPHQVIVGNEFRFYGRNAKGNRVLTEGDVARLYRRRDEWSQNREALLIEAVEAAGVPPMEGFAYVHAFARPVVPDQGMWDRIAQKLGAKHAVLQTLLNTVHETKLRGRYGPSLESATYWDRRGADEWRWTTRLEDERSKPSDITSLSEIRFNIDGRGLLFCGRAADKRINSDVPEIVDVVIAGSIEAFFAVMGMFYETAGYHGQVDVGVAITGLEGTTAVQSRVAGHYRFPDAVSYGAPTFTRTAGVAAAQLRRPDEVTHALMRHLFEAVSGIDGFNIFEANAA